MRHTLKVWYLFCGAMLFAAPPVRPATLSGVVESALRRSPALEQAAAGVREADAGLKEARYRSLPMLSGRSSFMRGDDPVFAFGSLLQQRSFAMQDFALDALNHPGYRTNIKSALELGVPLFTAFQLQSSRQLAALGLSQARSGADSTLQGTRFQAVEGYLQVLRFGTVLAQLDARIESAEKDVADAQRLKDRGLVLGSDFRAAQAILSGLRAWRGRLAGQAQAAASRLAVLTGYAPGALAPGGALLESLYPLEPEASLVERALRSRQDLRQAALQSSAAGVKVRQTDYSLLPTVEAFASVESNSRDLGSNPTQRLVGVRASLPLGDPSYMSRRAKAKAGEESARSGQRGLEQAVRMEVSGLYRDYEGLKSSLPASREARDRAEESLDLFKPLYREGRQSVLEVLRAEESFARAQAAYIDGLFELHTGYARLLLAAGAFDAQAVSEMDRQLGAAR